MYSLIKYHVMDIITKAPFEKNNLLTYIHTDSKDKLL